MTVAVVTDSSGDLALDLAREMNISVVLAAARAAKTGKRLDKIKKEADRAILSVQTFSVVDALKYLEKVGRNIGGLFYCPSGCR